MSEITNVDNHKLMYHPKRVDEWKEQGDCYPIYVEIGPTSICNHGCIFCALDFLESKRDSIDSFIMTSTLKEMGSNGVKSVMFAGEGESLLHKDISLFVRTAKTSGMDVSMTTNGVPFNDDKIKQILPNLLWLRFSVDSGSAKNYSEIHGTKEEDFERVMENIEKCVEYKKQNNLETTIGVQFLVIPQNMEESSKLAKRLKSIGVDNLQVKPYSQHPQSKNKLVVDINEYNKLEKNLMEYNSNNFKVLFRKATAQRIDQGINYPKCYGLPFFTLIDAKGNVLPCNIFYNNEEFTYGNLYEQSFSGIWKGKTRQEVLEKLNEKGVDGCREGCRLDVINRYLHRVKNPQPHDNFV